MKYTLRVIACISIISACLMLYDLIRAARLPECAKGVEVGDSKNRVESVLGAPDVVFPPNMQAWLFSHPNEIWVYGSSLETNEPFFNEFPWFRPFRFRLFRGHSEDVEVEFDNDGIVLETSTLR